MEKFYLADEKHVTVKGKEVHAKGVLYFHFTRKSHGGAPDFEFNGRATKEQVKEYPQAFRAFMKEHPAFKLPWADVELGELKSEPSKEEEKPAKKEKPAAEPKKEGAKEL